MISSLKKQKQKSTNCNNNKSFHKNIKTKEDSSYFTLKQKLQLFKLRKKPRKQIILRFSTITNGLQLPDLPRKQNAEYILPIESKVNDRFKISKKDNLSNANNYNQKGNRINISIKKAIDFSLLKTEGKNGFRLPNHARAEYMNNSAIDRPQFGKKSTFFNSSNGSKFQSYYSGFQTFDKQQTNFNNLMNSTFRDLQRTKNEFYNTKMRNYFYKEKLELNKKIIAMEGMVYQQSEQVINNA